MTDAHSPASDRAGQLARAEPELAFMVRGLELIYRRRKYPMERAHYLIILKLRDGPMASGALAQALVLDQSTITRQIAAMQRNGLVQRTSNPHDGRGVVIAATPAGLTAFDEMQTMRQQRLQAMLSDWPEADVAKFGELITRFNEALLASEAGEVLTGNAAPGDSTGDS